MPHQRQSSDCAGSIMPQYTVNDYDIACVSLVVPSKGGDLGGVSDGRESLNNIAVERDGKLRDVGWLVARIFVIE